MNSRRSFLALVGSVPLIGPVVSRFDVSQPTLVLPPIPRIVPEPGFPDAVKHPPLAAHQSQMHAFIDTKRFLQEPVYFDWLEGGLRMARGFQPGGNLHRIMVEEMAAGRDPWGDA